LGSPADGTDMGGWEKIAVVLAWVGCVNLGPPLRLGPNRPLPPNPLKLVGLSGMGMPGAMVTGIVQGVVVSRS